MWGAAPPGLVCRPTSWPGLQDTGSPTHLPDVDGALRLGRPAAATERHKILAAQRVAYDQRVLERLADSGGFKAHLELHLDANCGGDAADVHGLGVVGPCGCRNSCYV